MTLEHRGNGTSTGMSYSLATKVAVCPAAVGLKLSPDTSPLTSWATPRRDASPVKLAICIYIGSRVNAQILLGNLLGSFVDPEYADAIVAVACLG